jgi:UDP-N-acetylmuramyl pentapeptide synthase
MASRCIAVRYNGEVGVRIEPKQVLDCRIDPSEDGRSSCLILEGHAYEVASPSLGIARNAALALVAGSALGLSPEIMAARIGAWIPENTRGRIICRKGAYYYIDCYNANPSSMLDAIKAFDRSAPEDLARCYIIGAMNELGHEAGEHHRAIGRQLKLRAQDSVIFVGPEESTAAYREGAESVNSVAREIACFEKTSAAKSMVAEFEGALFLKGSRGYQLEALLPDSIA